jgi:sporulation protein YlmC with PRC-barrel domain
VNRKAADDRHTLYKEIILSIPLLVFTSAETARGDSFVSAPTRLGLNQVLLMKKSLSIAAMSAIFGLAVASTIAQTETTSTTYIETSKLVGRPVKSSQGEEVGTIKDVVLDRNTGCLAYTVLATGGGGGQVAGGGKMVAVPWSVYSASSDVNTYTVTVDRERIYSAPVFDYAHVEEYSRPDYINNVYGYFGVTAGAAIGTAVSSTTGETHTTNVNRTTGTTARGTSTREGAMASPGASAPAGAARSPAQASSPSGRGSTAPRATAERTPHETPAGRTHATPHGRSGATESSPAERTRGTKEEREGSTPPSGGRGETERSENGRAEPGRGETGTRSETERAPSEARRPSEKTTGSERHEKGKREANTPSERPQE